MERLGRWTFSILHVSGAKNHGPDALSRAPGSSGSAEPGALGRTIPEVEEWSADIEGQVCGTVEKRSRLVISWSTLREAGVSDREYADLLHAVTTDVDDEVWSDRLQEYRASREKLTSADGVVLY